MARKEMSPTDSQVEDLVLCQGNYLGNFTQDLAGGGNQQVVCP